jgi:oligosaccharide repeat unit polymerase
MLNVLIFFILVFQYIGFPFLLYFPSDNVKDLKLDQVVLKTVFFYTSITITLLILGFILGRFSFGKLKEFKSEKLIPLSEWQTNFCYLISIFCVIVLFFYIDKIGFESLALLNALGFFSEVNMDVARSVMTNSFEGSYHWYKLIITDLFSFVLLVFIGNYFINNSKKFSFRIILLTLLLLFSLLLSTEKGPLLIFLISLVVIYYFVKKNGYFSFKIISKYLLIFLFFILFIYTFLLNFNNLESSLTTIFDRIFVGQLLPALNYIDYFPIKHQFLLGRSFPNPSGIFPFTPFPLTQTISSQYSDLPVGVIGSSPTIFWAELYANFGVYGILVFPFFVGFFLYALNYYILKLKPNAVFLGYYTWSIFHFSQLSGTSLSTYLFDIYFIVITLIYFFMSFRFNLKNLSKKYLV